MRSCQEHSDREGLKQQSLAKPMQVNHKHYVLPGKKCYVPIFSFFSSPPDADADAPISLSQRVSENLGFLVAKLQSGFVFTENVGFFIAKYNQVF